MGHLKKKLTPKQDPVRCPTCERVTRTFPWCEHCLSYIVHQQ